MLSEMTGAVLWVGWQMAGFCSAPPQSAHSQIYRWRDTWTSILSFDPHKLVHYDLHFVQGSPKPVEVGLSQDIQLVGAELDLNPRLAALWPNIIFPSGSLSQDNPEWPKPLFNVCTR